MAELADALALGASAERRAGSSPVPRTIQRPPKALVIPANSDRTINLLTHRLPARLAARQVAKAGQLAQRWQVADPLDGQNHTPLQSLRFRCATARNAQTFTEPRSVPDK
jgi:hypothetical protein